MRKRTWAFCCWALTVGWILGLFSLLAAPTLAPAQASARFELQAQQPATNPAVENRQTASERAWTILREGLKDEGADKRARAVRALGLWPRNAEAEQAAVTALKDQKPNVRLAAAVALGSDARGTFDR